MPAIARHLMLIHSACFFKPALCRVVHQFEFFFAGGVNTPLLFALKIIHCQKQHDMNLAHSNDQPGVPLPAARISVLFVPAPPVQLQIKPMKSALIENQRSFSPSFEIIPNVGEIYRTPFEELSRYPDKLEASLNAARIENDVFAASREACSKRPTRSAAPWPANPDANLTA